MWIPIYISREISQLVITAKMKEYFLWARAILWVLTTILVIPHSSGAPTNNIQAVKQVLVLVSSYYSTNSHRKHHIFGESKRKMRFSAWYMYVVVFHTTIKARQCSMSIKWGESTCACIVRHDILSISMFFLPWSWYFVLVDFLSLSFWTLATCYQNSLFE